MAWPLSQDYNEALQNPQSSFSDAELRQGQVVVNALGIPQPCSGNFADVYAVECAASKTKWAVKCFTREVHGLRERYSEISKYLQQARLPFTVEFQYLEQGIRIAGRWYPILKMHWVEGFTLNAFVRDMLDKPAMLEGLSRIWVRMAQRLREAKLAHCDLQHGNVLLVPGSTASSLAVKLIDYDGMWVPALAQTPSGEVGHSAYQHPWRLRDGVYNGEVDRFPLLVIATALRCLRIGGRALWERYDTGDNLLFREADLRAPAESALFAELRQINDPLTQSLVEQLTQSSQKALDATPHLHELLPEEKPAASVATRGKASAAAPAAPAAASEPNAFQGIEAAAPAERSRRKQKPAKGASAVPWVVGGVVAACLLIGGVLFWALRAKSVPDKPSPGPDQQQAHANRIETKKPENNLFSQPVENAKPPNPKPPDKSEAKPPEIATVQLLDGPPGEVRSFQGHTGDVKGVAFSGDGKLALTAGSDKTVRLWNVASGKQIHCLDDHKEMVWSAAFSPDGKRAVSAGDDHTVRIWDLEKGKQLQSFQGHANNPVRRAVFSADGKQVFSAGWDRMVRLWDVENGREVRFYEGNKNHIYSMALSPDGKRILSTGGDKDIHCWDTASGRELEPYKGNTGDVYAIEFSGDGQFVAAGGGDPVVHIWRTSEPSAPLHSLKGHSGPVNAVAFTPDGQRLLSCSHDQTIRLWDAATGHELAQFYGPEGCKMLSVAVSPDGRYFLSGGSDHVVRLWRLPPPDVLAAKPDDPVGGVQSFNGHTANVRRVAFSFDGRHILSAGYDNSARLWETATGREVLAFKEHKDPCVTTVAFLPDGRRALSGGLDHVIRLWDLRQGQEIRGFSDPTADAIVVAVSPDGRYVAAGGGAPAGAPSVVVVWEVETGKVVQRLDRHERSVECVGFSPDGRWVVVGCAGGAIHLWDVGSGKEIRPFSGHTRDVQSFRFSPDGRLALSASRDNTLRLWDVASGKELRCFKGHSDMVEGAALSPDGRRAVSGSRDKTVRLWNVATGEQLYRFEGEDKIWDVAFSPDGRYVVSASEDKMLRLWRVPFAPLVIGRPLQVKAPEITVENKPPTSIKPGTAPAASKLSVPDEAVLKKAMEDIRELYNTNSASRQPDERVALAGKLLKRALNTQEEPGRRFAYFSQARDLAVRGGDAGLGLRAIDEMAQVFAVEPLPMKAVALELVAKALRTADAGKKLLGQALTVLDEAESADDYEQAAKALKSAQSAALKSGDRYLAGVVTRRQTRQRRLQDRYAKIADAVKTLADKPDNAEANLTAGKFQCFDKEDWNKGSAMLARGSDSALAELARKDVANPTTATAQAELGHGWWEFGEKQSDTVIKWAVRRRAQRWLHEALPSLSGDDKVRVENRLEHKIGAVKYRPGLVTELFEGENFDKRVKTRLDYKVQYNWGFGSPDEKVPADHFSIRWQGWLIPPRAGKYTFTFWGDDGARLYVDEKLVIDCWTQVGEHRNSVELLGKPHTIRLEFHEIANTAGAHLRWSLDGDFTEQTPGLGTLYHDAKQERLLTP